MIVQSRFKDAPWLVEEHITIGGAGTIGSNIAFLMNAYGYKIDLYEMDTVEDINRGSQNYMANQVGMTKYEALKELCGKIHDNYELYQKGEYKPGMPVRNICISGFDNMQARTDMYDAWISLQKYNKKKGLTPTAMFVDGRMTAERFDVYTVTTPKQSKAYRKTLFSDEEMEVGPCGFKATKHVGYGVGFIMTQHIVNHILNKLYKIKFRELPYRTSWDHTRATTLSYDENGNLIKYDF